MKRTERHRLKENEFASTVARATETFERNRTPILAAGVAALVIIVAVAGFFTWRSRVAARSQEMLAAALTIAQTPVAPAPAPGAAPAPTQAATFATEKARDEAALAEFLAVANGYPSTGSGIAARYHAAATMAELGRNAEAIQQYQEVVAKAGGSLYGEMARLGIADAEVASGKYDAAIATYKEMAAARGGTMPVDGILMQLANAYRAAGQTAEARQAYRRIVDEFPQSPYAADAKKAMDGMQG